MHLYYLMNKNNALAELVYIDNRFVISNIYSHMPVFMGDLQRWVDRRTSPIGRQNIDKLIKAAGIYTKKDLVDLSKAISLNDTLWIKADNSSVTWESISPYRNTLSKVMAELALGYGIHDCLDVKSPSPEFCTDGSFAKCWKRINGNIYMVKRGTEKYFAEHETHGNEPYSEYYVSELAKALGIKNIAEYHLGAYGNTYFDDGTSMKNVVSYCKCFTSEKYGFVPMSELREMIPGGINALIQYFNMQHPMSSLWIREMLLLDALTFNVDRHSGNYGVYIDNDTFEILRFAPIFDNNLALFPKLSLRNNDKDDISRIINMAYPKIDYAQGGFQVQGAKALTLELRDRLEHIRGFRFNRDTKYKLPDYRLRFLEMLIGRQCEKILDMHDKINRNHIG